MVLAMLQASASVYYFVSFGCLIRPPRSALRPTVILPPSLGGCLCTRRLKEIYLGACIVASNARGNAARSWWRLSPFLHIPCFYSLFFLLFDSWVGRVVRISGSSSGYPDYQSLQARSYISLALLS